MPKSCETLITKINEWQKAILELEKLSDEFLQTNSEKIKLDINQNKIRVEKIQTEYLQKAYPLFFKQEPLFWLEKEMLEVLAEKRLKSCYIKKIGFKIKNGHVSSFENMIGLVHSDAVPNLFLFQKLEVFRDNLGNGRSKQFPIFPRSIQSVEYNGYDLKMPRDISNLDNLETFIIKKCSFKTFPILPRSIKIINIDEAWGRDTLIPKNLIQYHNLEKFSARYCGIQQYPKFASSIKFIDLTDRENLAYPGEYDKLRMKHPHATIFYK